MVNEVDYVELGLACAYVSEAPDQLSFPLSCPVGNSFTDLFDTWDLPLPRKEDQTLDNRTRPISIDGTIGLIDSKHDRISLVRNTVWGHQEIVFAIPQATNRLHVSRAAILAVSKTPTRPSMFEEASICF